MTCPMVSRHRGATPSRSTPGAVWLWLEDIVDEVDPRWPIARFALAARHLGRPNGMYLTERRLPVDPWLMRGLLPARAAAVERFWERFADLRGEPVVRRIWPGDLADQALRLCGERDHVLAALDDLPRALPARHIPVRCSVHPYDGRARMS